MLPHFNRYTLYRLVFNPISIVTLGILLLFIASFLDVPIGNDEGVWGYIGRAWVDDHLLPYSGIVDNKTPGIFYLNYISYSFFGANIWFLRLSALFAVIATAGLIYLFVNKMFNPRAAIFSTALFVLLSPLPAFDGSYAQTETFMNLFVIAAFYFLNTIFANGRRYTSFIISGILCGLAIAFRQNAIITIVPLAFNILFLEQYHFRRTLGGVGIFAAGAVAATGVSILPYLASGGQASDYLDGAWLSFLQKNIGVVANGFLHRISGFFTHFFIPEMSILAFAVGWYFVFLKKIRSSGFVFAIPLFVWILADFFSYNLQGTYYAHHLKLLLLSWSICFGVVVDFFLGKLFPEDKKAGSVFFITALFVFYVIFQTSYYSQVRAALKGLNNHDFRNAGLFVRDITKPGDTIYVYGAHTGPIYFYSGRNSPSRHFVTDFLQRPGALDELRAKLSAEKPNVILTLQNDSAIPMWLIEFLSDFYSRSVARYGYDIYINKSPL